MAQSVKRIAQKPARKRTAGKKQSSSRGKAAKPRAGSRAQAKDTVPAAPAIFYRLHSLLHTVQTIAQYEDQLCALTNHARSAGTLDPEAVEELHQLLLELPSSSYHAELDAVHEMLHGLESAPPGLRR